MPSKKIIGLLLIHISSVLILSACGGGGSSNEAPTVKGASFHIPENAKKGFAVGKITGKDEDGDKLTYSIVNNGKGIFAINKDTGRITVAKTSVLDPKKPLHFTVKVTDTEDQSATAVVNIKVDDVNLVPASIRNNPNFSVANIAANGAVIATLGTKADGLTYTIAGGNTNKAFAIDPKTGKITVANPAALSANGPFHLQIRVTDGLIADVVTLNITVKDKTIIPSDFNPKVSINGVDVKDGANVGSPLGSANDGLNYAIVKGSNAFAINASTGQITVKNAKLIQPGSTTELTIRITSADGSLSEDVKIKITVSNLLSSGDSGSAGSKNNPFNIGNNATGGTLVGSPIGSATDGLTYSITGGNGNNLFDIDPKTGQISISDSATLETGGVYTLEIKATNAAGLSQIINISIAVNKAPVISATTTEFTILKRSAAGTVLGKINVTLNDASKITARNLNVSGTTSASPEFSINENDEIVLNDGVTLANSYSLEAVYASDKGDSNKLNVSITIVNDFKGKTVKIIPFGNSLTQGEGYSKSLVGKTRGEAPVIATLADVPPHAGGDSYRRVIHNYHGANQISLDFIGSKTADWVPDSEHEGWSGFNSTSIIKGDGKGSEKPLDKLMASPNHYVQNADIVMITLGVNDALMQAVYGGDFGNGARTKNNLSTIVNRMREANPNLVFLLANVPPIDTTNLSIYKFGKYDLNNYIDFDTYTDAQVKAFINNPSTFKAPLAKEIENKLKADLVEANTLLPNINKNICEAANALSTKSSPVIMVDMRNAFAPNGVLKKELLSDGIHPNDEGEDLMAKQWIKSLDQFFDGNEENIIKPVCK